MAFGDGLNEAARRVFCGMQDRAELLRVAFSTLPSGAHLLDCGVHVPGGLEAGLQFAKICLAGRAAVSLSGGDRGVWPGAWVQVATDHPVQACMLGQYAGWPVKHEKFFAMGSGPMRVQRGKEELLLALGAGDASRVAVGTLECDAIPDEDVVAAIAAECGLPPESLYLAIAPTRSIAGCVQVVARSIETAMHKLHELEFPLSNVVAAHGLAPLPTPTPDFAAGIGRTNDAILYGGQVSLWVTGDDAHIADVGARLPSCASDDFGEPFSAIFKRNDYDFYKIDPGLFSPAEVTLMNMDSGRSWRFGGLRPDLIAQSFATRTS